MMMMLGTRKGFEMRGEIYVTEDNGEEGHAAYCADGSGFGDPVVPS